jgi:hypothetical protein
MVWDLTAMCGVVGRVSSVKIFAISKSKMVRLILKSRVKEEDSRNLFGISLKLAIE